MNTLLKTVLWLPLVPAMILAGPGGPAEDGGILVFFGTYTRGTSKGIYVARLDQVSGKVGPVELAAETPNPSFLALHPKSPLLYAVSEIASFGGQKSGAISAFELDRATGRLKLLNTVPSRGAGPCNVAVDRSGKTVLAANYSGGSIAAFPIEADGRLREAASFFQHAGSSVNPKRQEGPHAHSVNISPDNRFVIAADLGLDQLLVYRLDPARALLTPNDPPFVRLAPGSGPRHFAFHPDGKHAYAINELLSTVAAFRWDRRVGKLSELQTVSTLPAGFAGTNSTAEVRVHPSGKFVYGSNRGHNSIAVFAVERGRGTLVPVEHAPTGGKTPRNFGIDPSGRWLLAANQDSNSVVVFRIDPATGRLTPTGQTLEIGSPVCVRF